MNPWHAEMTRVKGTLSAPVSKMGEMIRFRASGMYEAKIPIRSLRLSGLGQDTIAEDLINIRPHSIIPIELKYARKMLVSQK